jgi:GT2 family glycosyltransferase
VPDAPAHRPSYGVVVLTQGRRPDELAAALASVLAQQRVSLDVVVVGNGWAPTGLPDGVRAVPLAENVGIPAGRNAGVPHVSGDLLFFLDDDAALADDGTLADLASRFEADPSLGLLQPRVVDPSGAPAPRRWVPRLRVGDPARSSDVAALWEGAVAIPRVVFEAAGGWPDDYWYGHEGVELAWRVWDAGYRVRYLGDVVVHHPAIDPLRHEEFFRLNARNRAWLARRNLPWPLAAAYVVVWTVLTVARTRPARNLVPWFRGLLEGLRGPCGERRPMRWRTVVRMARAGRPPIV